MKVEIYGMANCKACLDAKSICEANDIEYKYHDVKEDTVKLKEVEKRLGTNITTVPQIFIDEEYEPKAHVGLRNRIISNK